MDYSIPRQCVDSIQLCGFSRREVSEGQPNDDRGDAGDHDRVDRDDHRELTSDRCKDRA